MKCNPFKVIVRIKPSNNVFTVHTAECNYLDPRGGRNIDPNIKYIGFLTWKDVEDLTKRANIELKKCTHCNPNLI